MPPDREGIPVPFDLYSWDGTFDPERPLTPFQEALIASALRGGGQVLDVRPHRRWDGRLTFPVCVRLRGREGEETVLLRMERFRGGVETEARVLPVLTRLGLPVPRLLAGPAIDPAYPNRGAVAVLSVLPGTDLQHRSASAGRGDLEALGALVFDGVRMLHAATAAVRDDPAGRAVPIVTLEAELQAIRTRGGPWLADDEFRGAIERLLPVAAAEATPLVFSNGDYNAGNFLSDGRRLTGIVDFARARFEDPYYGFAKYWTYDMQPFHGAGVVARALQAWGVSETQLALRLAIRCLWTLQREVPVAQYGACVGRYRQGLRSLLRRSLAAVCG